MKIFTFTATLASLGVALTTLGALPVARADVTVTDNNKTLEVDCAKDPQVHLLGNHITLTTRGVCATINISGNEVTVTGSASAVRVAGNRNTVTLAAADEITITGNQNTVTVQKPIKAKAVRISNPGSDNKITRPK